MKRDEFPLVDAAIEVAVLAERAKWQEKLNQVIADITSRKMDVTIYEYNGAYTDGKIAAHDYDMYVIKKYCGEEE